MIMVRIELIKRRDKVPKLTKTDSHNIYNFMELIESCHFRDEDS